MLVHMALDGWYGLGRNDIQTLPESRKAAEDLLLGEQRDGAGRGMPHFETAPFARSGPSPRAIREGREVSRWRPRLYALQTREV